MNRTARVLAVVFMVCAAALAPTRARAADAQHVEQELRGIDARWVAAIKKKDVAAIIGFYAADGALLAPGAPIAEGRDAIRKAWKKFLSLKNFSLTFRRADRGRRFR